MAIDYPLHYTLDDGVAVKVSRSGNNTYEFTLTPKKGQQRHFTYIDDDRPKGEIIDSLDFDQLNAVRRFWLERDDVV